MNNPKSYTVGFLFRNGIDNDLEVALILKTHPDWQKGKLNGIGGKTDQCEIPSSAMRREFLEESGIDIQIWEQFCKLHHQGRIIHYYRHLGDYPIQTTTDEVVGWYKVSMLATLPIISNLLWLIPLALDKDKVTAVVEDKS